LSANCRNVGNTLFAKKIAASLLVLNLRLQNDANADQGPRELLQGPLSKNSALYSGMNSNNS